MSNVNQLKRVCSPHNGHPTIITWRVDSDVRHDVCEIVTKLFLEVNERRFIPDKLQRASAFTLQQPDRRISLPSAPNNLCVSCCYKYTSASSLCDPHLSHVAHRILEVQLMENFEDVVTVLPRRWLHQNPCHPFLLKVIPPLQREKG